MPCNLHHPNKSPNLRPPAVAMTKRLDTAAQSLAWHTGTRAHGDLGIDRRVMWLSSGHNNAQESTQWFWDSKTGFASHVLLQHHKNKVDEYIMFTIALKPLGMMYIKPLKRNIYITALPLSFPQVFRLGGNRWVLKHKIWPTCKFLSNRQIPHIFVLFNDFPSVGSMFSNMATANWRNPAPPSMCKTLAMNRGISYPPCIWCRISSIKRITN